LSIRTRKTLSYFPKSSEKGTTADPRKVVINFGDVIKENVNDKSDHIGSQISIVVNEEQDEELERLEV
jgi:hypothetical protein